MDKKPQTGSVPQQAGDVAPQVQAPQSGKPQQAGDVAPQAPQSSKPQQSEQPSEAQKQADSKQQDSSHDYMLAQHPHKTEKQTGASKAKHRVRRANGAHRTPQTSDSSLLAFGFGTFVLGISATAFGFMKKRTK